MNQTRIIGITGAIGSGKSTAASALCELGVQVIDADALVHEIYRSNKILLQQLSEAFGNSVLTAQGMLDRKALGAVVFSDADKLNLLEKIVHPVIKDEICSRITAFRASEKGIMAIDAALLYEFGLDKLVDEVWVVETDAAENIKRAALRLGITQEQARDRLTKQMSPLEKANKADLIIINDASIKELQEKVKKLFVCRYGITGGS